MALEPPFPELDEFLAAVEATTLGNILVQAIALGRLPDIATGRAAVAASVDQAVYEPHTTTDWDAAVVGFDALVSMAH